MFGSLTTAYVEALAQRDYRAATRVVAHCVHKVLRCAESVDTRIVAVEAALRAERWSVRPSKARAAAADKAASAATSRAIFNVPPRSKDYKVLLAASQVALGAAHQEVKYLVRAARTALGLDPSIVASVETEFRPSGRRRQRRS